MVRLATVELRPGPTALPHRLGLCALCALLLEEPQPRTIVIDDDPFSGTQVGTYGAGTATVKGTQATVPVVLTVGLHPADNLKRNATVVVQKVGSAWEIANIITFAKDEPTTNFVADATKALARIK